MIDLSEELLMAYVDGQLDKPQTMVVTRLVHDDEALAQRVARLQQTQARLLETFGALLREGTASARPARNAAKVSRFSFANFSLGRGLFTAGTIGMLLLCGVCVGVTIAYYMGFHQQMAVMQDEAALQMPPVNWPEDMAELHAYFSNDTVSVSLESQTNPEVVTFQLGKVAKGMQLPDLSANGMTFARGQVLNYRGSKLMQLIYTNKSEPLVAVYVAPGGTDGPVLPGQFGDVKTVSWGVNGLRIVIAADMSHDALKGLAALVQSQMSKS
jgi:anti-sigma factor RsiW